MRVVIRCAGAAFCAPPVSGTCPSATSPTIDRKSTRLNSSHVEISYAVFCLKKKKKKHILFVGCCFKVGKDGFTHLGSSTDMPDISCFFGIGLVIGYFTRVSLRGVWCIIVSS